MRTLALAIAAALCLVPAAAAKPKPEPHPGGSSSAVSQYVEVVPSASGPTAPGVGPSTTSKLAPSVVRSLAQRGGTDAAKLKKIATSSDYGAPAAAAAATANSSRSAHAAPAAVVTVGDNTAGSRGWWLVGIVAVVGTAGVVAGVGRTRRRARPS
jgi:hypothetical protein